MISGNRRFWAILFLAFSLRIVGIGYGLPHVYYQDEPMMVNHAMAIGTGDWNTHYFVIPPFVSYGLFFIYAAWYSLGHAAGFFATPEDFAIYFLKDPKWFFLLGRFFLSVLFGTATVWLLYRMGKRFFSKSVGILAAFFLAICLTHVQHSHHIYADVPVTFVILLLFYALFLLLESPSFKNYALVGILLGWGTAVKYTAAYNVPVIVLAHALVWKRRLATQESLIRILWAGALSLAVFFVLAPYTFLDWGSFAETMKRQSQGETFVGLWHHFTYSILNGTSPLFVLLAILGVFFGRFGGSRKRILMGSFLLVFYGINTVFGQHSARYALPMVPLLCLFAALGHEWLQVHFFAVPIWRRVFLGVVSFSLLWPTLYSDILLSRTDDTRTLCADWIQRNVKNDAVVTLNSRFWGPPLPRALESVMEKKALLKESGLDRARGLRLSLMPKVLEGQKVYSTYVLLPAGAEANEEFLFTGPFVEATPEALRKIGAEYLVLSYMENLSVAAELKEKMSAELELLKVFSPFRDPNRRGTIDKHGLPGVPHLPADLLSRVRLGPYLEVYRLKRTS